jgi:broad specificity polyphosphatase/5'/3'-nucleotidase SurE
MGLRAGRRFVARLLARMAERGFPTDTLLNVNVPGAVTAGRTGRTARTADLPRRARARRRGGWPATLPPLRRRGVLPPGARLRLAAVVDGAIAVTPLHFDLAVPTELQALRDLDLGRLLEDGAA